MLKVENGYLHKDTGNIIKKFSFRSNVRLKTPAEYRAVFQDPIRSRSSFFTILATPNNKEVPRLGLVISKRYAKTAVIRNRIKRLIRENFRHHKALLTGLDIAVLMRCSVSQKITANEVNLRLDKQWKEIIGGWKKG